MLNFPTSKLHLGICIDDWNWLLISRNGIKFVNFAVVSSPNISYVNPFLTYIVISYTRVFKGYWPFSMGTLVRNGLRNAIKLIWDVLHDLVLFVQSKDVKNTHGGVLLLLLKVTLLHGCFSRFLYCTNGTKSPIASHV